ncbi:hypothetical protein [Embleya sp. NPDC020886]|uniref:hypothetical protein n=1 Tax=Embleya sp. NPDC020886 TaxID=3363980 RepID=UPI00379566F7
MTTRNNNDAVLGGAPPLGERIGRLVDVWIRDGRGRDHPVTGKAFFAVYSWYLRHWAEHDPAWGEFIGVSYDFIGGDDGWNTMLRERVVCETCRDTYRLENIGVCTGCMRCTCYACGPHGSCTGEIV